MTFSDAPACALHAELRRATRQAHRDLDRHPVLLPLTGSATLPEYQRALGAMYAITAPVESRVGAYLDARRPRLDYQVRRRMPNLMRDLEFYGLTPPGPAWSGPAIATDGELVGCLYVLEGGTRGSRFIFQRMTTALGITEELGGRFFSGYGDHAESTWQEFWSFAAEHCPPRELGRGMSNGRDSAALVSESARQFPGPVTVDASSHAFLEALRRCESELIHIPG